MFKKLMDSFKGFFDVTAVSTITACLKINGLHTGSVGFGVPKEMYAALDAANVPFIAKTADGSLFDPIQVARARVEADKTNIHTIVYRRSLRIDSDPNYDPNVPLYNESPYDAAVRHWAFHKALFPAEVRENRDIVWVETMNEVGAELVFDNEAAARAVPAHGVREVFSRLDQDGNIEWVATNAEWLASFAIETARMAMADGYRWAAFGFAGGNPEPEHWRGPKMVEFLKLCAANPDKLAVALHEYSWLTTDIWNGRSLTSSGAYKYDLIGRFTRLIEACDTFGVAPYPTIMITEWGWAERNVPVPEKAIADILEVGELYARYPNLRGAAVWYLGPGFGSIDNQTQKLIQPLWDALLTKTYEVEPVEPGPVEPPVPAPCLGLPRVQYGRVVNILPPEITLDEATAVFRARWQAARETVTGSYDDAGIGALDNKTAVLYGIPLERHAEFLEWYQTHYPGTEVVFENTPRPLPVPLDYIDAPVLAQCDPAWANELCGYGPKTLCQWGCLLTCYTMWLRHFGLNDGRNVLEENSHFKVSGGFSGQNLVSMALSKVYATVADEGWLSYQTHGEAMHTKARAYLVDGMPVPARVDFQPGTAAWEQHWVLLVGWDEARQDYIINDPWGGKKAVYLADYYAIAGSDVLECIYYQPQDPPVIEPAGEAGIGLHASADPGDLHGGTAEFVEFKTMKPDVIKVLSAHSASAIERLAADQKSIGNGPQWIIRAFLSGWDRIVSSQNFVNWTYPDVQRAIDTLVPKYTTLDKVWVELHNEPNLVIEGWKTNWQNGAEFGSWLLSVISLYRKALPGVKLVYPGLSPGGDVPGVRYDSGRFRQESLLSATICDGVGLHCYWVSQADMANTLADVDTYHAKFPGKPLWVTEASRKRPSPQDAAPTPEQMAVDYVKFHQELRRRPQVQGVTYFVASASNPEFGPESWIVGGKSRSIAQMIRAT